MDLGAKMYKVEKLTIDKKLSEESGGILDIVTTETLFKSAVLSECVRYLYSRKDRSVCCILDRTGSVVDVGDYLDYSS
jgi:hypothetical protein